MDIFSIIQKSQLEGGQRLDAEYYQPEYLLTNEILNKENLHSKTLVDIISRPVVTGSTPKNRVCKDDGTDIKFIKTDVVRDGQINFDTADLLPIKMSRKNSQPQNGDILLTIIGASHEIVGRAGRVFGDDPKMNINQNIAMIRPKNIVLSGYLESFLRSKFGRDQLWQQSRQTEQVNLNCREVENIKIPILDDKFQQNIEGLVNLSRKSKVDSLEIYKQAEKLLLQELGLTDFQFPEDLTFEVDFLDVKNAARMDADYFQPKYEELVKRIKEHEVKKLGEIVSLKKGIEPGSEAYQDEGKLFIRVSSLSKNGVEQKDQKYVSEDLYEHLKSSYKPNVGEILLTKDASPGIAYVVKEQIEGVISGGILRLKLKADIDAEYLALCINSMLGQMQIEQSSGGSIIEHWKPEQVRELVVPILLRGIQQQIGDLVRKSHEARKKSKELLEEAKQKVEEMIEKNDEKN